MHHQDKNPYPCQHQCLVSLSSLVAAVVTLTITAIGIVPMYIPIAPKLFAVVCHR